MAELRLQTMIETTNHDELVTDYLHRMTELRLHTVMKLLEIEND